MTGRRPLRRGRKRREPRLRQQDGEAQRARGGAFGAQLPRLSQNLRRLSQGGGAPIPRGGPGAQPGAAGGGLFRRRPDRDWEIGYWIGKPWWGKGFATELGRGLVDFAAQEFGAGQIIAGHYDDNPASGRVLEKLGFAYTGDAHTEFSMARLGQANCLEMVRAAA